jgi:hypothetical protein
MVSYPERSRAEQYKRSALSRSLPFPTSPSANAVFLCSCSGVSVGFGCLSPGAPALNHLRGTSIWVSFQICGADQQLQNGKRAVPVPPDSVNVQLQDFTLNGTLFSGHIFVSIYISSFAFSARAQQQQFR